MFLRDVMTKKVELLNYNETLSEASEKMRNLNVGAMPVKKNERLVGMLTDRDIVVRALALGLEPRLETVENIMTTPIIYCYEDQTMEDAATIMEEKKIRRLPVFDREKRLTGFVSLGDMAKGTSNEKLMGEILECVSSA